MRKALFVLVILASAARADTISYFVTDSDTGSIGHTGEFSIPRFDPRIGTLTSLWITLTGTVSFNWNVAQMDQGSKDFAAIGTISFMGVTSGFFEQDPAGSMSFACNSSFDPTPCQPRIWNMQYGIAAVVDETGVHNRTPGGSFSPNVSLDDFMGSSLLTLPVGLSVSPSPLHNLFASVQGDQIANWTLDWSYVYTPSEASTPVAHTPEPGTLALGLVGLIVMAVRTARTR